MRHLLKLKNRVSKSLSATSAGHEALFQAKRLLGRLPQPDYAFPESVSLELSSTCNLA